MLSYTQQVTHQVNITVDKKEVHSQQHEKKQNTTFQKSLVNVFLSIFFYAFYVHFHVEHKKTEMTEIQKKKT